MYVCIYIYTYLICYITGSVHSIMYNCNMVYVSYNKFMYIYIYTYAIYDTYIYICMIYQFVHVAYNVHLCAVIFCHIKTFECPVFPGFENAATRLGARSVPLCGFYSQHCSYTYITSKYLWHIN